MDFDLDTFAKDPDGDSDYPTSDEFNLEGLGEFGKHLITWLSYLSCTSLITSLGNLDPGEIDDLLSKLDFHLPDSGKLPDPPVRVPGPSFPPDSPFLGPVDPENDLYSKTLEHFKGSEAFSNLNTDIGKLNLTQDDLGDLFVGNDTENQVKQVRKAVEVPLEVEPSEISSCLDLNQNQLNWF